MADASVHLHKPLARPQAAHPHLTKPTVIQLCCEAENALSMALYHLRQPSTNVRGAARKTVQALAALNQLKVAGYGLAAANDAGSAA